MCPLLEPANLDDIEAKGSSVGFKEDVADEEPDGAVEVVTEGAEGVDGDGYGVSVTDEELRRDAEEGLVVPCRVVASEPVTLVRSLVEGWTHVRA